MKKIVTLIISILFVLGVIGFIYKYNNNNNNNNKLKNQINLEKELKEKLIEYTNNIITVKWMDELTKPDVTYIITLKGLKERNNYDISMFKNINGKKCDEVKTRAIFKKNEQIVSNTRNFEINYYVVCD